MKRMLWTALLCAMSMQIGVAQDQRAAGANERTSAALSPGVMRRLERATWIRDVHTKPSAAAVYVFADTDCSYCHQLWLMIQALKGSAGAEVRYILVGVITPQSPAKAAAILESKNPAEAFARHEAHFADGGGVKPLANTSAASDETLRINASLMEALRIPATPAIIYKDSNAETHVFSGLPTAEELKRILAPATSS